MKIRVGLIHERGVCNPKTGTRIGTEHVISFENREFVVPTAIFRDFLNKRCEEIHNNEGV